MMLFMFIESALSQRFKLKINVMRGAEEKQLEARVRE